MLHRRVRHERLARARAVLSAALSACVLAACSNGGGGGGGPAPSLVVTPSSVSTSAGGSAVALHASLTGSASTPTWTLSGPGTLSATSGSDVSYVPPASTPGNEAATATITASAGGMSQQAQVTLAETAGPGHHWTTSLAAGAIWNGVAFGGGRFVAVGSGGTIVTSTDGRQWTHADSPERADWLSPAYGPGVGWVVAGINNFDSHVMTSADGVTWTAQSQLTSGGGFTKVVFGNGVFVGPATGASQVSSDGGKTWTTVSAKLYDVAFGNGIFVGAALNGPVVSTDGRTWPAAANAGPLGNAGNDGVAFGNGIFVATTAGVMTSSTDGIHWTPVASAPANAGQPVFTIDRFYTHASNGSSTDGRTWNTAGPSARLVGAANADATVVVTTATDFSTTPANTALASGASVASATPVLPGSLGTFHAVDCGRADCVALAPDYAYTTTDRTTWTGHAMNLNPSVLLHTQAFGNLVAGGTQGNTVAVLTSIDGVDWMQSAVPAHDINGGFGFYATNGPSGLLAVTAYGNVLTSPDGGTWTDAGNTGLAVDGGVIYAGGRYVAVGLGSATSTDGVTWKTATAPTDVNGAVTFTGVVYDGQQYIAVGQRGLAATSPDGLTWTLHATASTAWLYGIARSDNGELVAVGDLGVVQTSTDGVHWTQRASGTNRWLLAVTATPSGFFAVGEDNVILYSSN